MIRSMITQFFQDLYASERPICIEEVIQHIPSLVTPGINKILNALVSDDEIKEVTFSLRSMKSPGLDGLSSIFFHKYW